MATIQDIADAAGVSKAAVSRILNHKGSFSEETILRVMAEAKRLNYPVEQIAEKRSEQDMKLIAAVFPSTGSPYFGLLASMCETEAYKYGYHLLLCGSLFNRERIDEVFSYLNTKKVTGILLGGFADTGYLEEFSERPVVSVGYQWDERVTSVSSDSRSAGILAARHLYHKGCRHPLYITGFGYGMKYDRRWQGFRDEFSGYGIDVKGYFVERHELKAANLTGIITKMMLENPDADGVFAESQTLSLTCLKVILQMGYRVPEEIKVIGYGNTKEIEFSYPEMTFIRENTAEIARAAVSQLVEQIEAEETGDPKEILIPVSLSINHTT